MVAHHLAVANAQAGTAAHLVRTRPEQRPSACWTTWPTPRRRPCTNSRPPSACCAARTTPTTPLSPRPASLNSRSY
ncbi:hypothetical protein [Streptomyces sp. NBC_01378]|uniref:hypothetical protein n=1 Tax=Streptomyces sp. NBC_01378 TaxID=2903844 RepID=UPI003870459D